MSDTWAILSANNAAFKFMVASWITVPIFLILVWAWTWWMLIGAVAGAAIALWLNAKQRDYWMFLSTICLGMEILATDFCGWGKAYPALRDRARELLQEDSAHSKTTLLDYYLPNRANIASEQLRAFAPPETLSRINANS